MDAKVTAGWALLIAAIVIVGGSLYLMYRNAATNGFNWVNAGAIGVLGLTVAFGGIMLAFNKPYTVAFT